MDDDNADPMLNLSPALQRYAELYPSVVPRLRAILASKDPDLRRRAVALAEAVQDRDVARLQRLMAAYRLTRAEARVALHIIDGGDVASYAGEARVSVGTARSQLKSIFAKTGVSRQSALVRLGQTL
jgi:DNA-binding CsgD family transcriptional regulator